VDHISRMGMDTSKHVFQLHGVNAAEIPVLRKKVRRKEMVAFFANLAPTVIAVRSLRCEPSLGTAAAIAWAYGKTNPASVGQAIRQAWQERCCRRRGTLRGDEPTDDALRACEDS